MGTAVGNRNLFTLRSCTEDEKGTSTTTLLQGKLQSNEQKLDNSTMSRTIIKLKFFCQTETLC